MEMVLEFVLGAVARRRIADLTPYSLNARTHSKRQIRQIADSITRFGFTNPVLVNGSGHILAGHGRVVAAKLLGWTEVPTIEVPHLSGAQVRAYILADNKIAANAGWDEEILALELQSLVDLDFDISVTGFSISEIDIILDAAADTSTEEQISKADIVPPPASAVVTRPGDLWILGRHRLLCGDALQRESYDTLLAGEEVDLLFTDPPYNVPIDGHVSGLGRVRHREFAMASGEMSRAAFIKFLTDSLGHAAHFCRDGTIAYVCMDWRHMGELLTAGEAVFDELKNVCVWNKTNGGMGTFYRSKHELVFVFKKGKAPHLNNFGLGDTGRYRTNVWDYPGVNTMTATRAADLAMHPTVKPVALVADAMRDCSRRGSIVLDPFGGSGSTLIAAQSCGRVARLLELDPAYCDTIVRRFQAATGKAATLASSGEKYDELEELLVQAGEPA